MNRAPFYRRLPTPLHAARAGVGALWAGALCGAALLVYHPLALIALTLAVLGAAAWAGVGREAGRALRTGLIVALPIVTVNVLVSREGLTVFARLGDLGPFGQGDLTVEALVYGAVIALKVTLLILITTLASLTIDPDELLRALRRLSFRSALTASLATRMVPLLAADAQRLAEAQRTRPGGAPRGARGRVLLLGALVGGSLDRAMDVAATLELRGFAAASSFGFPRFSPSSDSGLGSRLRWRWRRRERPRQAGRLRRPWSRHDLAFAASGLAVLALALAGRLTDVASFEAYPLLQMRLDAVTVALCAALVVAVLLPMCDRRGADL
ncbi:MAG TPA: energy-coupling factor transporter transmembrane component T [Solirubrobacteraceae bacterium]|jgi:energy-coupling factor transport system permease protein|nr:energy-coupling factor transporter transmembrane component T [Solirubrobacteraceae bacterium]